jgi:hypothetical protein
MRHVALPLKDKLRDVSGIVMPAMPRGEPGMERPDGRSVASEVLTLDADGKPMVFHA